MSRTVTFATVSLCIVTVGLILELPVSSFHDEAEGERWLQVDSLWRQRWTSLAVVPPGTDFDPEGRLAPASLVRDGDAIRSTRSAVVPLLASIPYAILGTRGIYLVPAAFTLLCLAAADRLARVLVPAAGPWQGIAAVGSVVSTPVLLHGAIFCGHAMAAALVTAGLVAPCKWIAARVGAGRTPAPPPWAWMAGGVLIVIGGRIAAEPDASHGGGLLLAASPALLIGAVGLIVRRRERPGGVVARVVLLVVLGVGAAMQIDGLREVAASRAARSAHAAALRIAVPEGSVILSDRREIPHLLATLSPDRPVLYLRPGIDLVYLDRILESAPAASFVLLDPESDASERWGEAIFRPSWRESSPVASIGGLSLFRRESRRGVRGFMRVPEGD